MELGQYLFLSRLNGDDIFVGKNKSQLLQKIKTSHGHYEQYNVRRKTIAP